MAFYKVRFIIHLRLSSKIKTIEQLRRCNSDDALHTRSGVVVDYQRWRRRRIATGVDKGDALLQTASEATPHRKRRRQRRFAASGVGDDKHTAE
eukprot:6195358-Pleurochrysis_carterae.AAC.1